MMSPFWANKSRRATWASSVLARRRSPMTSSVFELANDSRVWKRPWILEKSWDLALLASPSAASMSSWLVTMTQALPCDQGTELLGNGLQTEHEVGVITDKPGQPHPPGKLFGGLGLGLQILLNEFGKAFDVDPVVSRALSNQAAARVLRSCPGLRRARRRHHAGNRRHRAPIPRFVRC